MDACHRHAELQTDGAEIAAVEYRIATMHGEGVIDDVANADILEEDRHALAAVVDAPVKRGLALQDAQGGRGQFRQRAAVADEVDRVDIQRLPGRIEIDLDGRQRIHAGGIDGLAGNAPVSAALALHVDLHVAEQVIAAAGNLLQQFFIDAAAFDRHHPIRRGNAANLVDVRQRRRQRQQQEPCSQAREDSPPLAAGTFLFNCHVGSLLGCKVDVACFHRRWSPIGVDSSSAQRGCRHAMCGRSASPCRAGQRGGAGQACAADCGFAWISRRSRCRKCDRDSLRRHPCRRASPGRH